MVSCSAAAALCAAPAQAARGQEPGWCGFGTLSYSPDGMPPVVTTPDATALASGTLTDAGVFGMTDVDAVLTVAAPPGSATPGGTGAPLLAWRVNGGAWQPVTLTWDGLSGPGSAWRSSDLDLGLNLQRSGSATVDLESEFIPASPGGQYVDQLSFTAQSCGSQPLGVGLNFTDYDPAAAPPPASSPAATTRPAAAPSSPVTVPSQVTPSAPPSSPLPSLTPSDPPSPSSPSPSASPLKITFVQVLPSAEPVASTESGAGVPDGVLIVVAVVFLGGLVCIRAVRRRKSY